jgi:hypothetical protein
VKFPKTKASDASLKDMGTMKVTQKDQNKIIKALEQKVKNLNPKMPPQGNSKAINIPIWFYVIL